MVQIQLESVSDSELGRVPILGLRASGSLVQIGAQYSSLWHTAAKVRVTTKIRFDESQKSG